MFGRVPCDVGESFCQAIWVPNAGHVALELHLERGPEFLGNALAYLAQIGGSRCEWEPSAEANAGELEQMKDHPRYALAACDDTCGRSLVIGVKVAVKKQRFS